MNRFPGLAPRGQGDRLVKTRVVHAAWLKACELHAESAARDGSPTREARLRLALSALGLGGLDRSDVAVLEKLHVPGCSSGDQKRVSLRAQSTGHLAPGV